MPQDAYTLNFLAKELDNLIASGKVNKITQPDQNEVYMNIYANRKNYKIVLSASVAGARVCLSAEEKQSPLTAFNFCMLLRKHLLGGVVKKVELDGFDRVIKITFSCIGDFFDVQEKILYVEIMGKYSNVVLTANGKILGALKSVGIDEGYIRPLLTGMAYVSPPKQDKYSPSDSSLYDLLKNNSLSDKGEFLFNNVMGLSKQTADEIAHLYSDLSLGLKEFVFGENINPCVGYLNGKIVDFFVKPYESLALDYKFFPTLLEAEEFYYKIKEDEKNFNSIKNRLTECVKKEEKKFGKRLKIIMDKQFDCRDLDKDRINGELIISNIYKIKKGDDKLVTINYYDNSQATIKLDVNLSPQENAEKYFKRYNKQKRTLLAVEPQKVEVEREIEYLKSIFAEINLADNVESLLSIEEELFAVGLLKKQTAKKKKQEKNTCLIYQIDGFTVNVGRNNVENDTVTFSARGNDVWLHTKAYHSSHVIIQAGGKEIPENVILKSAEICAYYSEGRQGTKIEVDYTKKSHVKKPKGAKPGFVVYTDFKSLLVTPNKNQEFLKNN